MVKTKAEELAEQVNAQTKDIADLKALVIEMKDVLYKKIDEVKGDISSEVNRLEVKITEDIDELKQTDAQILHSFNVFKEESNGKVDVLQKELDETKTKMATQYNELILAAGVIAEQQTKIVSLEKECHRGLQHGRGFNVEIDGIPKNIGDDPDQLEAAALKIFAAINVDVNDYDIDTIHRLPSKKEPKTTIVRFVSRKTVRSIHLNKSKLKDLKDLDLDIAGITEESRVYIKASQCSYVKNLAFNCRKLKRAGLLSKIITGKDGRITIILNDGNSYVQVNHESVLKTHFPEFEGFDFNYDNVRDEVW